MSWGPFEFSKCARVFWKIEVFCFGLPGFGVFLGLRGVCAPEVLRSWRLPESWGVLEVLWGPWKLLVPGGFLLGGMIPLLTQLQYGTLIKSQLLVMSVQM